MALLGGDSSVKLVTLLLASSFVHQYHVSADRIMRHMAVEITDGPEEATRVADKYGLINLGQVGELEGFYHFAMHLGRKSSMRKQLRHLKNDYHVGMVEIQRVRHHQKKAYTQPSDPMWSQQWQLLNREQLSNTAEQRLDLNIERVWMQGITGAGVTVAIVDDGLVHQHPDLSQNYDPQSSYDFVHNDRDPTPYTYLSYTDEHGTSCAGIVAMTRNNGKCGVGVAYNAKLAGLRLLSFYGATDIEEATAFNFKYNNIDIYSNSWGPHDTGYAVQKPGPLATRALEMGIRKGRFGKGSIYVWAAGNGGINGDSCAVDGYASSIYTIAVGSADINGAPAYYDEKCSSKLVVVYNHGDTNMSQTVTTAAKDTCTTSFTGTSAAAPLLAGTLALALQANPTLTWRDVQHLLVYTSDSSKLVHSTEEWRQNGAGLWFNHQHGFGAVNAEALVTRARHWSRVPDQIMHHIVLNHTERNVTRLQPLTLNFTFPDSSDVTVLEHVEVIATLSIENQDRVYRPNELYLAREEDHESIIFHSSARRGDIEITLTSPYQTKSTVLPHRERDFVNSVGFKQWPFMSVHFWGENPTGEWSLSIGFKSETGCVRVKNASVIYHGTSTKTQSVSTVPKTCSKECSQTSGCASSSPADCDACNSYRDPITLACLPKCTNSTIPHNGYCIDQKHHFSYHYSTPINPTSSAAMETSFHSTRTLTIHVTSTETISQPMEPTATPSRGYGGAVGSHRPPLTDSLAPSSAPNHESRALSIYIILVNLIIVLLLVQYL